MLERIVRSQDDIAEELLFEVPALHTGEDFRPKPVTVAFLIEKGIINASRAEEAGFVAPVE